MEEQNEQDLLQDDKLAESLDLTQTFSMDRLQGYGTQFVDYMVVFLPKLFLAIIVWWIGFKVVKKISKVIGLALDKSMIGMEVSEFLKSIISTTLKVIIIGIAASIIGVKMTALLGLLGAAVFAIGMALQGFMGNFASGLTILFLQPYKVGDWVSVEESFGKVKSIQIFNTTLETPNDKTLVIPNGQMTDNVITNYSEMGNMRLSLNVTMPYAESFPKVKEVINSALKKSQYIVRDSEPLIGIESNDSHFIILAVRPYIKPDDYWAATYEIYGLIKEAYSQNNIKAAYSEGVELGPIGA